MKIPRQFSHPSSPTGFTLIELLVVIAIIGTLASIILVAVNSAKGRARDTTRVSNLKQIQLALELYFDGQIVSQYPLGTTNCDGTNFHGLEALKTNNYLPVIPKDPLGGCYRYASGKIGTLTIPTTYHLSAKLEYDSDAFATDKDCISSSSAAESTCTNPGAVYTGAVKTYGNSATCESDGGADSCFDVIP